MVAVHEGAHAVASYALEREELQIQVITIQRESALGLVSTQEIEESDPEAAPRAHPGIARGPRRGGDLVRPDDLRPVLGPGERDAQRRYVGVYGMGAA